jgi:HrpA-like RNA helicase
LEDALLSGFGDKTNIICTQPRRISALSVAERVADEMDDIVGKQVGYHIRMEAKKSKQTKLLFCTTGVILRRLQDDPNLNGITHVIVDEVHERQWEIDFLLIALRTLLNTTRRADLKVVLVSVYLNQYTITPIS